MKNLNKKIMLFVIKIKYKIKKIFLIKKYKKIFNQKNNIIHN